MTIIEWDAHRFHERVAYWELLGYKALRETYEIKAEIHPETGAIMHQYRILLERDSK